MSLATRCTSCGTVFRVVQDQLKVSEGWVRCGRCDEVFNALEGLFDLEREPLPEAPQVAASTAQKPGVVFDEPQGAAEPAPEDGQWPHTSPLDDWDRSLAERIEAELLSPRSRAQEPLTQFPPDAQGQAPEFSNARWDAELLTDVAAQETQVIDYRLDQDADEPDERAFDRVAERAAEPPLSPTFVRDADRQARWQRPGVRALLGGTVMLLMAALALQVTHHFRDTVAARWPGTQPALTAWCEVLECTLEPPRRIEHISVESTTLARANGTTDAFRLSVNLRNRGELPLSVPSVDLKLTDGGGSLVARRVLSPRDFGSTLAALAPGSDTTLQLLMSTGNLGVTGYTVEVFYP